MLVRLNTIWKMVLYISVTFFSFRYPRLVVEMISWISNILLLFPLSKDNYHMEDGIIHIYDIVCVAVSHIACWDNFLDYHDIFIGAIKWKQWDFKWYPNLNDMLYLYGYKGMKLGIFSGCDLPLSPPPPHKYLLYGQNINDRLPLLGLWKSYLGQISCLSDIFISPFYPFALNWILFTEFM